MDEYKYFRQGRILWTRTNILDKEDEYRGRGKCSLDCFSLQAIKASIGLSSSSEIFHQNVMTMYARELVQWR